MNFSGVFRHFPSTLVDGIVGQRVTSMPKCPEVESKKQAQAEESHHNKGYRDGALLNSHDVLLLLLRELELLDGMLELRSDSYSRPFQNRETIKAAGSINRSAPTLKGMSMKYQQRIADSP